MLFSEIQALIYFKNRANYQLEVHLEIKYRAKLKNKYQ